MEEEEEEQKPAAEAPEAPSAPVDVSPTSQVRMIHEEGIRESYFETKRALDEAMMDQEVLQAQLQALESRNQPAKFLQPVIIRSVQSIRGGPREDHQSDGDLLLEYQQAQAMLAQARDAAQASRDEQANLFIQMKEFREEAHENIDLLVLQTIAHHRKDLQHQQELLTKELESWNHERGLLLAEIDELSASSQIVMTSAVQARETANEQRRRINQLAAEMRRHLALVIDLRRQISEERSKIQLNSQLSSEIAVNARRADVMTRQIAEQKVLLRAVRISDQAKTYLQDLENQIVTLQATEEQAKQQLKQAKVELEQIMQLENAKKKQTQEVQAEFHRLQSEMLVLDSDIRELSAESERQRKAAIAARQENFQLEKRVREGKLEAAEQFVVEHIDDIHRVESVCTTLGRMKGKLEGKPVTALTVEQPKAVTVRKVPKRAGSASARRMKAGS
jgi:chromosome segregation ATPase